MAVFTGYGLPSRVTTMVGCAVRASVAVTMGRTSRVNFAPSWNGWPDSVMVISGLTVSMTKSYGPTVVAMFTLFVTTTLTVCGPSPVTGVPSVYALPSTVMTFVVGVAEWTRSVKTTAVL